MKFKIPILIVITAFLVFTAQAQNVFPFACSNEKPSSEKDYQTWLERDVLHIIHNDEKKEFLGLKTNKERDAFIEKFWSKRDSNIGTPNNEFHEEYCQKANETYQFTTNKTKGWKTDRGRVYILSRKPAKIEIGRGDFKSLKNVLFEKWTYRYTSGITLKVEFIFYNPNNTNQYVLSEPERIRLDANKYFPYPDFSAPDSLENWQR